MVNLFVNTPAVVEADNNILFNGVRAATKNSLCCNSGWLGFGVGSGLVQLTKPGIYKVDFAAQITAAAAGDAEFAITVNGEPLAGTQMGETLTAEGLATIATTALIPVDCGGSVTVAVRNIGDTDITVNAATLTVTREC